MPKIVDKKQKKKEIAQAAIRIIAQKGFENTTIQEIAEAAKIGKGTIYQYFSTKEDIIIQISQELVDEMDKMFGLEFFQIDDPLEKLHIFVKKNVEMLNDEAIKDIAMIYIEIMRINLRENNFQIPMKIINDCHVVFRNLVAEILEDGKRKKIFKKDVPSESLAVFLVAALDGVSMHYLLDKSSFDVNKVCDEFMSSFVKGIAK